MIDNNFDISFSIYSENKNAETQNPLKYILPRRVYKWVDDDAVCVCHNCNKKFSMFVRRHHCRFCGRIFCFECSNYQSNIPQELLSSSSEKTLNEYFTSYFYSKVSNKHKVCINCKTSIDLIDSIKKLIDVFLILKLDICDLKRVAQVCLDWQYASNYILSIFRETQYKLSFDNYTDIEKMLLLNNIEYLSGHNTYLLHLIKSSKSPEEYMQSIKMLTYKKKINCWTLMCTRNCNSILTQFDAINLLCFSFKNLGHNDILRNTALSHLICSDAEFKCYIPLLLYYIRDYFIVL